MHHAARSASWALGNAALKTPPTSPIPDRRTNPTVVPALDTTVFPNACAHNAAGVTSGRPHPRHVWPPVAVVFRVVGGLVEVVDEARGCEALHATAMRTNAI